MFEYSAVRSLSEMFGARVKAFFTFSSCRSKASEMGLNYLFNYLIEFNSIFNIPTLNL